ncbi:choline/carnitine/betaine transport [Spinactinospora alkalitolerans]|uniref:Choline/carnitine/betaine transport n=1 Tax=Spinactinospora alkalitolerans TaxID=687207 RepID=A0A852TU19_9ACTN|nr:BCCT family transporter [Spinactinospora alkalitolerans]NYE46253.1 choline/carnitine/betaine transport [Spinactinospora alkalitolerans]
MLDNLARRFGLRTNPQIFFVSTLLAVIFVVGTILFTEQVNELFSSMTGFILSSLSWFYILGVTVFLGFLIWIALSRFGAVRLGGPDARPEYSNGAWFAMLFAAGIGTILMFWGVAEPINHYANPPQAPVGMSTEEFAQTAGAAKQAITFTNYHFALHTWAIFTLPALAFSYFIFKRGLPMRVSSIFHPFLGDRIHGPIGKVIDVTTILGTLFGLSVSIGLGSAQINSGLAHLFGLPTDTDNPVTLVNQLVIIAVITAIATISVALGLDKGIKRLSNINIVMAIGLLIFVFFAGSTLFLAKGVVEQTGDYLARIIPLAFWNDTYADTGWQDGWTVFYWAWTITWAPFIGIFVARISKGRTIRQFVTGVLGLPSLFSVVWFGVFGLASFDIEQNNPGALVTPVVEEGDIPGALFAFLGAFPVPETITTVIALIAVVIVAIFFITSADSAALVIDMMCSGDQNTLPPARQRIFWAILGGLVALALVGGAGAAALDALAEVITVVGLPFFIMSFLMMASLVSALRKDPDVPGNEALRHQEHERPDSGTDSEPEPEPATARADGD